MFDIGDWVFPNVHLYFHNKLDPTAAVRWTKGTYDDLKRRCAKPIIFKEVGFPTQGDKNSVLSEDIQEQYYSELRQTDTPFVYFEAFDQPWKNHLSIEPQWGIFKSDRTPKTLGLKLMGKTPIISNQSTEPLYVFKDAGSPENHYRPSGYMGDCGDIAINEAFGKKPYSGETCIRVIYKAKGAGPNECPYAPPCKWAGVYWQEPPNNWGQNEFWKGRGFDLTAYNRLTFWAKADEPCTIEFKVAGIDGQFGDSQVYPRSKYAKLSAEWKQFSIDLEGANRKHIIGGFGWETNWDNNPDGATFYIDEIRFDNNGR